MGTLKLISFRLTCVEEAQGCKPVADLANDEKSCCHLWADARFSQIGTKQKA